MNGIDFVIPWVDGNDENWIKEKSMYDKSEGDKRNVRYRDWDVLKYWFRGVEKYAPWVRKIHFITWGHVPEWLNVNHPKLNIVKHEDYIPSKYLPTFSSHTIELNMHKIKGLSEKFVYFNDDCFVINETKPTDFFVGDLPCDIAALYPGYATSDDMVFDHILLNDAEFFAKFFDIKDVIKKDKRKWFRLSYGENLIKTLTMWLYPDFTGLVVHHQPQSFLKSTLEQVWEAEEKWLDVTCQNKFRTKNDINQYAFRYWQIGKGMFYPKNLFKRGDLIPVGKGNIDYDKALIKNKSKIVVLNDTSMDVDFEEEKAHMQKAFDVKFKDKCSYEI